MNGTPRFRVGVLEFALLVAVLMLVAQAYPDGVKSICAWLWEILDVSEWTLSTRLFVNASIVAALLGYRYLPKLFEASDQRTLLCAQSARARAKGVTAESRQLEERIKRDTEWAKRAKGRRPFS